MSPVRLYLLAAIPFFFVFSASRDESVQDSAGILEFMVLMGYFTAAGDQLSQADPSLQALPPLPPELAEDSAARAEWRGRFEERREEVRSRREAEARTLDAGFRRVLDLLPILAGIVMVPFLAGILSLGMRPKEPFVARLVFSLHLHTVGYILAVVGWLVGWQLLLGLYGSTLYFGVARKRLKGESIPLVVFVTLLTLGAYAAGFVFVYTGFVQGLAWLAPGWVYGT